MQNIDPTELWMSIRSLERQLDALKGAAMRALPAADMQRMAYESHFAAQPIYHITPLSYYNALPPSQDYLPEAYATDGFIHCTRGADLMVMIANRHYKQVPGDFALLVLDTHLLKSPLKFEAFDAAAPLPFPHIYGPINRDAIVEIVMMVRSADGTFLIPPFAEQ